MNKFTQSTSQIILYLFFFVSIFHFSKGSAESLDSLKKNQHFEVSFGHSLLFISDNRVADIHTNAAVVVPTSALLLFAEIRPQKIIRIPVFFNLPTESKQFIVNDTLVNERASPTFGFGAEFKIAQIKIDDKSKIDFEAGPLMSFLIDEGGAIRIAPVVAGRVRVMRGENFVMYIGGSYSFGIDAAGILFGTGTIF